MVLIKRTENFYYGASDEIVKRARILRKTMTEAELKLWNHLNKKQVNNIRFRRQHPIGKFIVDFYCHTLKLVIEIDGGVHQHKIQHERDENRTFELEKLGLRIIRFDNKIVMTNIGEVLHQIENFIHCYSKDLI